MMKRVFDVLVAATGLLLASPLLLVVMFLVWRQDGHSPFYVAKRVGKGETVFNMVKLRSMVIRADTQGPSSTSDTDNRITKVGSFIRRYKLDELTQLWNVLRGDMSLVGPRPQVPSGVELYTPAEMNLLSVRPGITDFASIVFADEGAILKDSTDPDRDYDLLIRPWKSRLGLIYIKHRSIALDIKLIVLTLVTIISRARALSGVCACLRSLDVEDKVLRVASRLTPLRPSEPLRMP
jgi:lipopolysaccharide/colanic/teichoic acid biosynthesis glycosyltransferase